MKLIHASDLHLGKRLNDFSLIEDQKYILCEILRLAVENAVDGILLAGDIYDKSVPSVEAVDLLDDFITEVSDNGIPVFIVSGNHDSPERLDFGSRIMQKNKVFIAGEYDGQIEKVTLPSEKVKDVPVNIYLMPYLRPSIVNRKLDVQIASFDDAIKEVLDVTAVNKKECNILVAHQFVTASGKKPAESDSETKALGGLDNVDVSHFADFDYVALGHIHRPQSIGRNTIRYSGSPLKYSFSEANHEKSIVLINIDGKGKFEVETIALIPQKDLLKIRCALSKLGNQKIAKDSYVHITLTDDELIYDAIGKVRDIYPNVMQIEFDNLRTQTTGTESLLSGEEIKQKTPFELFRQFFEFQNGSPMTKTQVKLFDEIVGEYTDEA